MLDIRRISTDDHLDALAALLIDAADSGASIGFLPPLSKDVAADFWRGREILGAFLNGRLVGSVQLELAWKPNAPHRAEVQKLLVLRSARGQGIGRALMDSVEAWALELDRTLLVLDTKRGDLAESMYRKLGWIEVGVIPRFCRSAAGEFEDTVVFYKELTRA